MWGGAATVRRPLRVRAGPGAVQREECLIVLDPAAGVMPDVLDQQVEDLRRGGGVADQRAVADEEGQPDGRVVEDPGLVAETSVTPSV